MMANVTVETDTLKKGGANTQTIYDNNEVIYNKIINLDCGSLSSFDLFKSALTTKNDAFKEHTNILNKKINECANNLEEIDNLIANNVITPLASADNIEFTDAGLEVTQLANYELSNDIDYTFDPSNVGISAQELYAKAEVIKNSNLPMNIKIVKVAKLFHEYTMTWTYSKEDLTYNNKGYEGIIEADKKKLDCATGVAVSLYLSGAITYDESLVDGGQFNPHYPVNVRRWANALHWEIIPTENLDQLQPGDIIMFDYNKDGKENHTEIYAGDGNVYNWGREEDLHNEGPSHQTPEQYKSRGAYAIRVVENQTA